MPTLPLRRWLPPAILAIASVAASLPCAALTVGDYRSARTDASNRESQDAYLYVTFQGMVWYASALHEAHAEAPGLFCMKPEQTPGEQELADLILTEASALKADDPATLPMEVVLLQGLERRFPCR